MDGSEYLKYMTEQVVSYMEIPSEEEEKKQQKMISREPWLTKWFGAAPMGLMMWWNNKTDKKNKTHPEVRSVNSTHYR
ncbi:YqzE family protein [Cohnella luojiensis]|uniref:YqzE family protein n=1 Tax=Cohnella luojiensis TaxID=652876 RepID=A0A4Y8LZP4_9BACL|nr:YqzE family protein [Cohnella luojiensis]TFE27516.1 YqzE family protein [Cohnella luojiensis]